MNPELVTCIVMAFLVTSAGILDWWLAKTYGIKYTMTDLIRRVTLHNVWLQIAIVLAFGMLIGHFFLWPSDCVEIKKELMELKMRLNK